MEHDRDSSAEPQTDTAEKTPSDLATKKEKSFLRGTVERLSTAFLLIPFLLLLMFTWPKRWFMVVLVIAIGRAGFELMRMTMSGIKPLMVIGTLQTMLVAWTWIDQPLWFPAAFIGSIVVGVLVSLLYPEPAEQAGLRFAWLVAGPLYIGGLFGSLGKLHQLGTGSESGYWVLSAMWSAWMGDTCAYFFGKYLGKHKLAPRISPKKTIEGSIGGLAGSATTAVIAHYGMGLPWAYGLAVSVIAGAFGQAGDLAESLIKRSTGFKDSGNLLPGHGGMLDRVDGLMFASAVWLAYSAL